MCPIANITGPSGATWLVDTGPPGGGLGAEGDLYLDKTNSYFYLRTGGVWVFQGQLTSAGLGNMDGGNPASTYGGTTPVDGGGP